MWDVMFFWRKGNINKNCLCVTVLRTIIMVHKVVTGWSTVSGFDLAWFSSLSSKCLCVFSLNGAMWILKKFFCLHPSLYLLVSWVWWDWPLTWLTNHHPSVLWHCWLGHVTRKTISEMTYNVSSVTINSTTSYGFWMSRCAVRAQRPVSDRWLAGSIQCIAYYAERDLMHGLRCYVC